MRVRTCGLSKPTLVFGPGKAERNDWEDISTGCEPICVESKVPKCAPQKSLGCGDGDEDKWADRRPQPTTVSIALWTQLLDAAVCSGNGTAAGTAPLRVQAQLLGSGTCS
jgi:hypothetical protein